MDKYQVVLLSEAYKNIDEIYEYISKHFLEPETALNMVDSIEEAIFSLEHMPKRGAPRRYGIYASKDYRQLFVKNYTIIYRVDDESKQVVIVAVRYSKSRF